MRRIFGLAAFPAALALVAGMGLPGAAAVARDVSVRVIGLSRDGLVVRNFQVSLLADNGASFSGFWPAIKVPTGHYLIAAGIPTYHGAAVTSETLVVRRVFITASGTVTLSAEHGRPVSVALNAAGAVQLAGAADCPAREGLGDGRA